MTSSDRRQGIGALAREHVSDALIILAVLAECALVAFDAEPLTHLELAQNLAAIPLGAALLWRRRHYRWLIPIVLLLNMAAWSTVVMVVATCAFASRARSRLAIGGVTLLAFATSMAPVVISPGGDPVFYGVVIGASALCSAAVGMYLGARQDVIDALEQRAEHAEEDRASAEESARRAERTRIAREMHDIVAHKISLVALQAGALEVNQNLDREQVLEAAGLIRKTATQALTELREVLGVLRGTEEKAPLAPQPTWDDVRTLVETSKDAGIAVELYDFVADPVPDPLARTAHRIVQEGLTNIHKHARLTSARVALIGEPGGELTVEVSNTLPLGFESDLPGARMGLSGIETRVAHAGGTISAGPSDDGRFVVRAVLPWPDERVGAPGGAAR